MANWLSSAIGSAVPKKALDVARLVLRRPRASSLRELWRGVRISVESSRSEVVRLETFALSSHYGRGFLPVAAQFSLFQLAFAK